MKRHKLSRKQSRKQFKSGARIHSRNVRGGPMRGGIRL